METALGGLHTVAIFGGSGATGKALISHALARGLNARVLVRDVKSMSIKSGMLETIEGSLMRTEHVESCLRGSDAAICAFGPRPPDTEIFCEAATRNVIAAMQRLGLTRLVCQTGAMIGDYPTNRTLPFCLMVTLFNRRLPLVASDRAAQENAVRQSSLTWTIVKPCQLTERKSLGKWAVGPKVRAGLLSSIPREDLADFLIDEALNPQFAGEAVFIHS